MNLVLPKYFWLPEITGHLKQSKGFPNTIALNDPIDLENGISIQTAFSKKLNYIDEGLLNYYSDELSKDSHQPELAFLVNVKFSRSVSSNPFPYLGTCNQNTITES